MNKETPNGF